MRVDTSKSLQELEGQDWGEPSYPSHLVTECHRLRRVPLQELSPEDLRLLIGQEISLPYLVPLALDYLQDDPFVSGRNYPGDLLEFLLLVPRSFWSSNDELHRRAIAVATKANDQLQDERLGVVQSVPDSIVHCLHCFLKRDG